MRAERVVEQREHAAVLIAAILGRAWRSAGHVKSLSIRLVG